LESGEDTTMSDDTPAEQAGGVVDPHLGRIAVRRRLLRLRLAILALLQRLDDRCATPPSRSRPNMDDQRDTAADTRDVDRPERR
jgi:hypothetical protein